MRPAHVAQGLSLIILLAPMLSACAGPAAAQHSNALDDVYTSVALTVAGATHASTPTPTPAPTSTAVATSFPFGSPSASATATPYSSSYASSNGCDTAAFVSDLTIPDGIEFAPGEAFSKTWRFLNTGSCAWSGSYSVAFVSGDQMDGSETEIDQAVAPGAYAEISVWLTAPDDEGTYTGYWRLANRSGMAFGEEVYVQIVVSDEAVTSTPTATSTSLTNTSTSTPTVPSPTATPLPANTSSTTPTESPTEASTDPQSYAPSDTSIATSTAALVIWPTETPST